MMTNYRKTVAAVLGALGTWCAVALTDGHVSTGEWVALGIAVATALGVYSVPNDPQAPAPASTPPRAAPSVGPTDTGGVS